MYREYMYIYEWINSSGTTFSDWQIFFLNVIVGIIIT